MSKEFEISKELKKWEDRVFYNVAFKKDTNARLVNLEQAMNSSLEKFNIIAANSEALVYKIGRFFIEHGIKNNNITFIDGVILESYLGGETKEWKKKDYLDEFMEVFGENCKGKWVFVPKMSFQFSVSIAALLVSKLKRYGAVGFVFFSEGPNNLTEILSFNFRDPNFQEFPKELYRKRIPQLPEDEW